jgi:DNA-binding response OmpR family regulator
MTDHPTAAAGPPSLLVVDDEPQITRLVERLCQRQGYLVRSARDVPAAWQVLQDWRPDLILLDLNLLGERGLVLCRRLRQTAELASLPVALFGDWQRTEDIVEGVEAGIDFVIAKDLVCRPGDWQARLQEVLETIQEGKRPPDQTGHASASLSAEQVLDGLNRGLRQLVLHLAPSIVRPLLWKAVDEVFGEVKDDWLSADGLMLDIRRLELPGFFAKLETLIEVLAGRLGRLGGHRLRQAFEQAMVAAAHAEQIPIPGVGR